MRVYLDTCALNRLWDDRSQPRVEREAAAVQFILALAEEGTVQWVGSAILHEEVAASPRAEQRESASRLLGLAAECRPETPDSRSLAASLHAAGFGDVDARHLALAKVAVCTVFITTDDRLIAKAARSRSLSGLQATTPDEFLARLFRP